MGKCHGLDAGFARHERSPSLPYWLFHSGHNVERELISRVNEHPPQQHVFGLPCGDAASGEDGKGPRQGVSGHCTEPRSGRGWSSHGTLTPVFGVAIPRWRDIVSTGDLAAWRRKYSACKRRGFSEELRRGVMRRFAGVRKSIERAGGRSNWTVSDQVRGAGAEDGTSPNSAGMRLQRTRLEAISRIK